METSVHKALYGNVGVDRAVCPECKETAFVIRGKMACCDLAINGRRATKRSVIRISEPVEQRKTPTCDEKAKILSDQKHKCFWCDGIFGNVAIRVGPRAQKMVIMNPNWDHVEPFAWSFNNDPLNFVAACSICNGIKSSKMFSTLEDTKEYILERRKSKGWNNT